MEKNKRKNDLIFVILMLFIRIGQYFFMTIGSTNSDTDSFVNYVMKDCLRTPGYPLLIDFFQFIMHDKYYVGVCIFQSIVSAVSLLFVYRSFCIILHRKEWHDVKNEKNYIAKFFTFFYAINPIISGWDFVILAESLAISITVFFLYSTLQFVYSKKYRSQYGVLSGLLTLVGTSIKTSLFIYTACLLVLVLILALFDKKDGRKALIMPTSGLAVIFVLYLFWTRYIYNCSGVFNFSTLSVKHQIVKCLQSGLYRNYSNQEIVSEIDAVIKDAKAYWTWSVLTPVYEIIGGDNQTKLRFSDYCLKSDTLAFFNFQVSEIINAWKLPFYTQQPLKLYLLLWYKIFRVLLMYIAIVITFASTIADGIKNKTTPYTGLICVGGELAILISVFWGSYGDWGRLLVYVLPLVYCSFIYVWGVFIVNNDKID